MIYEQQVDNITFLAASHHGNIVWTATFSDNLEPHRTSLVQNQQRDGVVLRTAPSMDNAIKTLDHVLADHNSTTTISSRFLQPPRLTMAHRIKLQKNRGYASFYQRTQVGTEPRFFWCASPCTRDVTQETGLTMKPQKPWRRCSPPVDSLVSIFR